MPVQITIKVPNLAAWQAAMAEAYTGIQFQIASEEFMQEVGYMLAERVRARVPVAFGTLRAAVGYRVTGPMGVEVGVLENRMGPSSRLPATEYAQFVEEGRNAGGMPPPNVLRNWMQRVGFQGSEYVLRRHLAEHNTPARPFLKNTLADSEKDIEDLAAKHYEAALEEIAKRTRSGFLGGLHGLLFQ